jgi:glycosyltransferase involved in cell wall biosynthesis
VPRPDISVIIPARNEGAKLAPTLRSIARGRVTDSRLEFVIVDDASTDDTVANLMAAAPDLLKERRIEIKVHRSPQRLGIYRARNLAASLATAHVLFGTDAHVRVSPGWDAAIYRHIGPDRILAGITTQAGSAFRGYGCHLLVPFMGTCWNSGPIQGTAPAPVATCHATVMMRDLFVRLGGYDPGMILYGAGEPEFSVRAWLHGAEIIVVEELRVEHEFKPRDELDRFIAAVRPFWVHNCLRFGLLYLSEPGCLQLLRFYARTFPSVFPSALRRISRSDVWQRRSYLEGQRQRSFAWFVDHFGIRNQAGGEII